MRAGSSEENMPNAKSKWEHYLASLVADRREVVLEWFEGRPPKVRALFRRFPPGSTFSLDGRTAYVISVAETTDEPGMLLSYIDPAEDYDKAVASRFFVCGEHLR
jgi:hypothetical protein